MPVSDELKPLGSAQPNVAGMERLHIERLYIRCDALLLENQRLAERVEALEKLLGAKP